MEHSPEKMSDTLLECLSRLEQLVSHSSTFLQEKLKQVGHAMHVATQCDPGAIEQDDSADFPEREAWERQKALEEVRIREQLEHLAQSWKELEHEQRRIMMRGRELEPEEHEAGPSARPLVERPSDHSMDLIDPAELEEAASAAKQFQRLRREIRHQARKRR